MVSAGGVVNNEISYVCVYRNTSSPGNVFSFATRQDFPADTMANDLIACDLDGDGKKDIAVTHTVEKKLSIYTNTSTTGSISFAPRIVINLAYSGTCLTSTDFDYDGKPDIAIGYDGTIGVTSSVAVFRNTGSAGNISFAAPLALLTGNIQSLGASTGDIDNDGKTDLVVSTHQAGDFSVFRNLSTPGNLSFSARTDIGNSGQSVRMAIADMDSDGKLDLLTTAFNFLQFHPNTSSPGTISFASPWVVPSYPGIWMPCVDDLDGDGKPDIANAIGIAGVQGYGISVIRNLSTPGNISFNPPIHYQTNISTNSSVAIGDIDGDFRPDIAVSNFAPGVVTVLRNRIYSPRITSFTPTSACYGKTVAINGANLTGITSVAFGGTPAFSFTVVSPSLINAIVGNGSSGNIIIQKPGGINGLTFIPGFTFLPSSATITSFTPINGNTGNTVTINGTNFTNVTAVSFGGMPASSFTVASPTMITAVVGAGASGNVNVTADGCIATLPGFVFGNDPGIFSFTPVSAGTGTTVTIAGINFTGTTAVSFGGVAASSFAVVNATTISSVVATGASGSVSVTTVGGTASLSGFTFIPAPTITSFTPASASTGTAVTITGTNFTGATAISFGGTPASSFTVVNATTITAVVGTGTTGNVSVTTPGGTASRSGFTYTVVTAVGGVNNNNSSELHISPNPANDMVVIKHPASLKNAYLKLIDINGRTTRLVAIGRNVTQTSFSVKGIATGIYKLIWTNDKKNYRRTLMITQ